MRVLVTAEQMRSLDRAAIDDLSIPGLVLMENAGRAFVDVLGERAGPLHGSRVVVVAGKGNNGGDGFVIARHLLNRGCSVTVVLLGSPGELQGDARVNYASLVRIARRTRASLTLRSGRSGAALKGLQQPRIVVDALFGTGFSGAVRGVFADAIRWMNSREAFRASVDIASGVNASTGEVDTISVRADLTVTMDRPKIGQFVGAGREHSGDVVVVDISIPRVAARTPRDPVYLLEEDDVREALPRRGRTAHKYSVGKVLVVGGSRSFSGAPALAALGALRAGAGAVILAVPGSIHHIVARKLKEVIVTPLAETADGTVSMAASEELFDRCRWADTVALGPGLGRHEETDTLVRALLSGSSSPMIVDADALTAVGQRRALLARRKGETVLTPHAGELSRLRGIPAATIERERVAQARDAARAFRSIVVLKGSPTATASPKGDVTLNPTGNPGMATVGSGDVLTGVVAGLTAQGMPVREASRAAVYLHGLAGDLAAARFGMRSMVASDLLEMLPAAFTRCEAL